MGARRQTQEDPVDAAVLAPVFRDGTGDVRIVLVVRSDHGVFGGQLALPGGRPESTDATMLDTALREAEEEIGLPRSSVEVLERLEPVLTRVSGHRIHPFLGRVPSGTDWRPQAGEIVGVLTPRIADLTAPGARGPRPFTPAGGGPPMQVDGIPVGDHLLWGATLRILEGVLPRIRAGHWRI